MSAYYIQQPDGTLQLQYGAPPAGMVQVGGAPMQAGIPSAPSMVATPQMGYAQMPQVSVASGQPLMYAQSMVATPQQPHYTSAVAGGVFGATHAVGNAVTGVGAGLANATGSVVHGAGGLVSSGVGAVGSGVGYATHGMGNAMSQYMPESVSNLTRGIVHGTGNAISGVTEGIGNATAGVTRGVGSAITGVGEGVSNMFASGEKALESNFQTTASSKSKKKSKKKSSGFCC
eukprot:TRINITY_DN8874_c1_g1_i5.p1 TRINITY_DN8874_c1_g1~~TRINITY_DN8874_c1_g1_i5.p1  ORF type:complete len:250 (+),score=51.60 TRINITY_DN8874_c1_g1_i5:58-750(+)